jgi:hypothetical protein
MRTRLCLAFAILIAFSLCASADSKIKTKHTVMGHSSENTVYIKGARERNETAAMGMGPALVTLTQCDQKRIITINPQANTCMVMPLGGDSAGESAAPAAAAPAGKGGVIIFNINTIDTGERQKLLGLNVRHIKSTMSTESSADACSKTSMRSESDGWYADIAPALSCSIGVMPPPPRGGGRSGCQDTMRFKRSGVAAVGYPLKVTTTMTAEGHSFTTVSEVVGVDSATLDASLFEMPPGCKVVSDYMELMNVRGMMADAMAGRAGAPPPSAPAPPTTPEPAAKTEAPAPPPAPTIAPKSTGIVRVGVVKIKDATEQHLPTENLRINLMSEVSLRQMEAVPLDSDSDTAIAAEAKSKDCDYILYTDASQVKDPSSGGVVLPTTLRGVSLDKSKYQALLAMTLYRTGKPLPELKQAPVAADGEQMGVNAVMAAFEKEAQGVADQVKKDREPPKKTTPVPARKAPVTKKPG